MPRAESRWRPHTHRDGAPKTRYATMGDAVEACRALIDRDDLNGRLRNSNPSPYPCEECSGWHVGNWSDEAWRNRPWQKGF